MRRRRNKRLVGPGLDPGPERVCRRGSVFSNRAPSSRIATGSDRRASRSIAPTAAWISPWRIPDRGSWRIPSLINRKSTSWNGKSFYAGSGCRDGKAKRNANDVRPFRFAGSCRRSGSNRWPWPPPLPSTPAPPPRWSTSNSQLKFTSAAGRSGAPPVGGVLRIRPSRRHPLRRPATSRNPPGV